MINDEVRLAFPAFTARFEGRIPWMYLDVKGLVTIGVGVLLASPLEACAMFGMAGGDQWRELASRADAQRYRHACGCAWTAAAQKSFTTLRLTDAQIDALTLQRIESMALDLGRDSIDAAAINAAPSTAQLAVLSMAWALGSGFLRVGGWPRFRAALRGRQWAQCALECTLRERDNPGVIRRNSANRALLAAAATGADFESTLHVVSHI